MTTLLVYAPALAHTKKNHPENHTRLANLLPRLEAHGVLEDLTAVAPEPATLDQLRYVHTENLIAYVQAVSLQGGGLLDQGDTYATSQSYDLARLAVGGCCKAVDWIMTGRADNGFALVRPPGHHAETDHASGFCLFNNIAAAARHAQVAHGVKRVLVLDFDVHHGNGTQDIFYEDESVLFVSMHLYAPYFYPGIGGLHEIGTRRGRGFTLNVPFPPSVGDAGYKRVFDEVVHKRVAQFRPELILVSAGFDAHWRDPLAMADMSLTGYAHLVRALVEMAQEWCNGRILFVLEGGYQLDVLTFGIVNVFNALLGRDQIFDPIGISPNRERDVGEFIARLKVHYLLT